MFSGQSAFTTLDSVVSVTPRNSPESHLMAHGVIHNLRAKARGVCSLAFWSLLAQPAVIPWSLVAHTNRIESKRLQIACATRLQRCLVEKSGPRFSHG